MSNFTFSKMPSVGISRSRFERTSQHKTSFNLGDIVPIYVDEVLPGDTRSIDLASVVRMSTPIAPIMDNIYLDFFAFFVPNRLVWDHWKEFMGENRTSAGIPLVSYSVPGLKLGGNGIDASSLLPYLGIPAEVSGCSSSSGGVQGAGLFISSLPFRGYYLIYNEWFRNQNLIAPQPVYTGDNFGVLVGDSDNATDLLLCKASKLPDYFTKALPYAQKGDAVKIPMGSFAPLIGGNGFTALGKDMRLSTAYSGSPTNPTYTDAVRGPMRYGTRVGPDTGRVGIVSDSGTDSSSAVIATNLGVNVASIAGTIDQLRYAFQLQKLLWKDAAYGSRYWELLASHFGITAPDASLQRPEYLGGKRMNINIDQVLSTAGYSNTSSTTVGAPGANSVSAFKGSIFTKSFTEHGWLYIMAVARHDQTYGQGINRMFSRKDRFDYYWPVFANLGSQEIKKKELYLQADTVSGRDPEGVFGYQEAWSEYRFKPSIASGKLNPNVANSLDFWTLSNKFTSLPTLGQTFIEQDRNNLARALVTGSTGPDFIADFYFRDIAVRPIPTFSLPGFADHH